MNDEKGSESKPEKKAQDTSQTQKNNPLHGVSLAMILERLVDHYGWTHLAYHVDINCFHFDPSIKSSLKFLRKTPWARDKVEKLYLNTLDEFKDL